MPLKVDLNADMGESFGAYKLGLDGELLNLVTSANIACGFHAGDYMVMQKTVSMAASKNVAVGAHPGFPDLQGFGRRNMQLTPEEVRNLVIYQIGALQAFARAEGTELKHVKSHGALYNMAAVNYELAKAIAEAVKKAVPDAILLALANSEMVKAANDVGVKVAQEVFADRAYNPDGTLVPRSIPGAVIQDPTQATERALRMVLEGKVTAIDGQEVHIVADSICVHGDNPQAVKLASNIRKELERAGVALVELTRVIERP